MSDGDEALIAQVDACVDALGRHVPELICQFSLLAVAIALGLHVNGALRAAIESGACTPEKARLLIEQLMDLDVDPNSLRLSDVRVSIARCAQLLRDRDMDMYPVPLWGRLVFV